MNTLVVVPHADPSSLSQRIARSIVSTLHDRGEVAELADLAAEKFDPRFADADLGLFRGITGTPIDVIAEQERLNRADTLVLVFPVYWWSMPALLKGWIDRVFVEGFAYDTRDGHDFPQLGRFTIHLVPLAGDTAEDFDRHKVYDAIETQIERGIIGYTGAVHGSTTYVHGTDSIAADDAAQRVRDVTAEVVDALATKRVTKNVVPQPV